ncbi:MAG: type II and III secretion system protein family protein [Gemmatimonadaceae bacterium]|nr:type II and III secretion system protein family protein [Acetobacteraceae bacterium]
MRALLILAAMAAAVPALAQPVRTKNPLPAVDTTGRQSLALEAGTGRILVLNGTTANVFVADPRVAEVRPASATSLFLFGVNAGRTTVAALDASGGTIAQYEVTVRPSSFAANEAEASVARLMPGARVRVTPQAKGLLLTGEVASPADAARTVSILKGYMADGQTVDNQLSVRSAVQVTLRVRIVEMSRTVTRSLGVNWQAMGSIGKFTTAFLTSNPLTFAPLAATRALLGTPDVNAIVDALAQDNLAKILAEPNLTVMSGESASFLAGGEFPIPVAQQLNQVSIEFKKFGVALRFVPTVLSDGRINLHVNPEVSQLSDQGAIRLGAGNSSIQIPALSVRRAETTVELGSGQSFAIAGLLQDTVSQTSSGLPFLGDIPVLGALFRSAQYQRQETELVILVTPYVSRPVDDPGQLVAPDTGYTPPNDLERILLLRQVGQGPGAVPARIPGRAGFVVQ